MIRCFIAIELDVQLRAAIAEVQRRVRSMVEKAAGREARMQWVRPEAIHVTIKFLGDVEEGQVGEIRKALARVATSCHPGSVDVAGLGVFPDLRNPRVLWVGLQGGAPLVVGLAEAVDRALADEGFLPENRPFSPHLTLARIKEGGRAVGRALEATGALNESAVVGTLPIRAVAFMKSELHPSGSVYTRLAEFPLGAAG